jgi:hypothetical protein
MNWIVLDDLSCLLLTNTTYELQKVTNEHTLTDSFKGTAYTLQDDYNTTEVSQD